MDNVIINKDYNDFIYAVRVSKIWFNDKKPHLVIEQFKETGNKFVKDSEEDEDVEKLCLKKNEIEKFIMILMEYYNKM